MTALVWHEVGKRFYETGADRGVFYPKFGDGVAWSGLVSVEEPIVGGEQSPFYYDGVKYLDVIAGEDFQAVLSAYSAPSEFGVCDGTKTLAAGLYATQQPRKTFDLSYRTLLGNDSQGSRHGYKLHLVWNCTASPSPRSSKTLSDAVEPELRVWTLDTVPPQSATFKPTAHLILDSTEAYAPGLVAIEERLYGTDEIEPYLPSQGEIADLLVPSG